MSSGGLSNTLTVGVGCDWDFEPDPDGKSDEKISSLFLLLAGFFVSNKSSSKTPFCFVDGAGVALGLKRSLSILIPVFLDDELLKSPASSVVAFSSGLGRPGDLGSKRFGLVVALESVLKGLEDEPASLSFCLVGGLLLGRPARF